MRKHFDSDGSNDKRIAHDIGKNDQYSASASNQSYNEERDDLIQQKSKRKESQNDNMSRIHPYRPKSPANR